MLIGPYVNGSAVIIGGLVTSTLLTLFVIPATYRWFDTAPQAHRVEGE